MTRYNVVVLNSKMQDNVPFVVCKSFRCMDSKLKPQELFEYRYVFSLLVSAKELLAVNCRVLCFFV